MFNRLKAHSSKDLSRPDILIVEDQPHDIVGPYMLAHHLGLNVHLAFDGDQAWEALTERTFDLVILDWNMPHRSGEELLRMIDRSDLPLRQPVNIVLHTGEPIAAEDFDASRSFRVLEVWRKPLTVPALSKKIKDISFRIRGIV